MGAITGRLHGIVCWLLCHHVRWCVNNDGMCPGDIVCETCGTVCWCRWHDWWRVR